MKKTKAGLKISLILFFLFFVHSSGYAQNKSDSYRITSAQWQSDLSYLQKKIHNDYSNLFYNVTAKQFDSAVTALHKQIPHLTESEIHVGFVRLIALFKIGHTEMRFKIGENEDSLKPMFHFFPVTINPFSDGLFIQSIDARYKEALGGRLVKIGNCPVEEALKKMHAVISCENEQYFKSNLHYFIRLPEILAALKIAPDADTVVLTYIKNGTAGKVELKAEECPVYAWYDGPPYLPQGWVDACESYNKPASALWMKEPRKIRYFEYLKENKTVYVHHTAVVDRPNDNINDFFEKALQFADSVDVEKFVLDIRLNGGGNNYLNKSVITKIIESKKINRYGHLFVITGRATFSAAQNLTNELEKYTEAIFVGEPTAENVNFWGDIKTEILPISKLNVKLSWLWWQNMDPRDKRQWTAPDLAAAMSFENYKTGYDSAMNIILNYKEEKRIDEKIKELVTAGNFDEALSVTKEYMENPVHRYCKNELEEKINDMAYGMIMQGKPEEAKNLFSMNVRLFPNSANVYDSYAECLYRMGQKEEAIKNYEIAISKDPKGDAGENSRKMLATIRGKL
jgi:tetratricopeptide (TPR) repeat protein